MEAAAPLHSHLKVARKSARKTAEEAARELGVGVDMIYRYESGRSDISLSDLGRLAEFYGQQVGDLFPSSKPRTRELQPFLMALEDFEPEERPAIIDKAARDLAFASMLMNGRIARREATDNVVAFPQPERTVPRLTEEFPVEPADFIEGDFDYPLELHALEVEEFEIAAGGTGVNPEVDMAAYTLHAKDVRDSSHRVVKVKGDSMEPDYGEGWKLLVDTRKREPQRGDPVAVYLNDQGSVLGYWNPTRDHVELEKANRSYKPVRLGDPETWHLIGTVQKVVDAPAKRRKK